MIFPSQCRTRKQPSSVLLMYLKFLILPRISSAFEFTAAFCWRWMVDTLQLASLMSAPPAFRSVETIFSSFRVLVLVTVLYQQVMLEFLLMAELKLTLLFFSLTLALNVEEDSNPPRSKNSTDLSEYLIALNCLLLSFPSTYTVDDF